MRTVERLNLDIPEHAGFMFDLAVACQDEFLNDYENDLILIVQEHDRRIRAGDIVAFLFHLEGQKAGIVWVDLDGFGVGRLNIGLMPQFRQGWTAMRVLRDFVDFCFDSLDLRKLASEIPPSNRTAETLLRRIGFKKEGLLKEALLKGGKPLDTLMLGLTRNRYRGLSHVKEE